MSGAVRKRDTGERNHWLIVIFVFVVIVFYFNIPVTRQVILSGLTMEFHCSEYNTNSRWVI